MVPRKSPFDISLTKEERGKLQGRARSYTSSYMAVFRAKIVLYAAEGLSNKNIAERLDTSRQVVSKWRKRFFDQGLEGLEDSPRRGRPGEFSPLGRRRRQSPGL